jgi:hypothetical protein
MKQIVFTAGSGRSGTTSLTTFINDNLEDCTAFHEPSFKATGIRNLLWRVYLQKNISSLDSRGFGNAINWCDDDDRIYNRFIAFRAKKIREYRGGTYFEGNHAFLKSLWRGMITEFPQLKIIHLVRDPLEVAHSLTNRVLAKSLNYKDAVCGFERWNVRPGLKDNVLPDPNLSKPTMFQLYIWAWIEMELRCVRLRRDFPHIPVFDMSLGDFNDEVALSNLLSFLGSRRDVSQIKFPGINNANKEKTIVSKENYLQTKEILHAIPLHYLRLLPNPYGLLKIYSGSVEG